MNTGLIVVSLVLGAIVAFLVKKIFNRGKSTLDKEREDIPEYKVEPIQETCAPKQKRSWYNNGTKQSLLTSCQVSALPSGWVKGKLPKVK